MKPFKNLRVLLKESAKLKRKKRTNDSLWSKEVNIENAQISMASSMGVEVTWLQDFMQFYLR